MNVYNYHPITKEYLGKTTLNDSDKNPLVAGEYLIPANAIKQWPTVKAGDKQAVIFNGSGWSLVDDFRGVKYWLQTGEHGEPVELGEPLPIGALNYDPVALAEDKTAEYEAKQQAVTEEVPE
ncbi:hypothetical protein [Marinomonas sp.]|uniref:hypothetical protein n=1 Tax=Marinomonas sp. TaxID=1904862 RepID=UPI003A8D2D5A